MEDKLPTTPAEAAGAGSSSADDSTLGLPRRPPEQAGFDPRRLERAMALLEQGRAEGAYPGAVALVARHGAVVAATALGLACQDPPRPMALDTIFDLASVTKVVAGLSAVLLLIDRGVWSQDDSVARFIPRFGGEKRGITLRHLLTHTSGLPPWLPCYTAARTLEETVDYISRAELEAPPGTQVQYSDLGMALIRDLVRRVTGDDLPAFLRAELFAPLGMRDTSYLPPASARDRIAATELGNSWERAMVERAGLSFDAWRTHLLVGEVHDGNAHYALNGISSHAGLFAPIGDLARFGQLYLQRGQWRGRAMISPAAVAEATRLHTAGLNEPYGLGWRLRQPGQQRPGAPARSALTRAIFPDDAAPLPGPSWHGDLLSLRAFGHTGFTGTSLAIDPERDVLLILLTNRVHPDAGRGGIERVRARWHNAVVASIIP
ncbi:MAG TPA: serine hydrolase domain-containing protein [Chloroflexota bacterium]|nr:serine hydrolase domain-containing protein [Chloroflexota bacterium]